jgi:hypothetical protein
VSLPRAAGRRAAFERSQLRSPAAAGCAQAMSAAESQRNEATRRPEKTVASIEAYHAQLAPSDRAIGECLEREIGAGLPEAEGRIWHAHPVWFLDGNPVVGYSRQKPGLRLMFWSGADFDEPALAVRGGKFRDASVFFNDVGDVPLADLRRWLGKARAIQWDYLNLVKRKGRLERLK